MTDPVKTIVRTSEKGWLESLARAYKARQPVTVIDDAGVGIDPAGESLFSMGVKAKLSPSEIAAVCVALGMSATGIGLIIIAFVDPEPTSKLWILLAGGVVLILSGGWGAIHILTKMKPPRVAVSRDGFDISWE